MKIAMYIRKDYYSHGKQLKQAFESHGQKVKAWGFRQAKPETVLKEAVAWHPDVFFMTGYRSRFEKFLYSIHCEMPLVVWYNDEHWLENEHRKSYLLTMLEVADLIFLASPGQREEVQDLNKVVYYPDFFDPSFFTPVYLAATRRFYHDVAFVGNNHIFSPGRIGKLEHLAKYYRVGGFGSALRTITGKVGYGSKVAELYGYSKIGLNFVSTTLPVRAGQFSARVFQIMGCGAMLITEPILGLPKLFDSGKQYVGAFWPDIPKKIQYYCTHEEERLAIAQAGQREVLRAHTVIRRARQYIDEIEMRLFPPE